MLLERAGWDKILKKLPHILQHLYMLFVVVFGWVFFRIENWGDAIFIQKTMLGLSNTSELFSISSIMNPYYWTILFIAILMTFPIKKLIGGNTTNSVRLAVDRIGIFLIFILSIIEMANNTYNPFIYFRF